MNRHRHLFLLLLVALILASVAIALAGWWAVEEQEKADAQRAKIFKDQFAEEVRGFVLNYLNGIVLKLRELPREAVLPGGIDRLEQIRDELVSREQWIDDDYPNSAVAVVGWVDGARLVFPSDPVSLETRAKAVKRSIENPDFIERKREADLADIRKNYEEEITIFRAMSRVSDPNQRNLARFLLAGALMRAGRTREGIDLYTDLLKLPSYVVDEFGDPLVKHVIDALLGQDSPDLERAILDRISQETDSPAALSRSEQFLGPIVEKLARVRARDPEVGRDVARTSELFVKQTKKLERVRSWPEARAMQESFEEKPLGDSSEADQKDSNKALDVNSDWRARTFASEEIWLVRKISTRSEPSLVVAVRADQIQRVFETRRRKDFENERIQLLSFVKCKPGKSVYVGLPGLCFQARAPLGEVSSWIMPSLFAVFLAFVAIVGPAALWLLWRDMRREVYLAELRSQFVSSVSHELKTPLAAIRMFAETLQIREIDGPKHALYLEIIVSESERLTRLLNNVLDFSRMERGQQRYQMHVAELSDVVQSVARTMRVPLTAQGFDFRVEVSDAVPPTAFDRDAIEQAVLNLLSNAMKYSDEKRDIALSLRRQNGSVLIQVADSGIGIPAEEQERIFEKYYRAQTPENQTISGAGLGLALVAHIATAHGGSVEVESAVGRGSTFTIRLPIPHAGGNDDRLSGDES